MNDDYDIEQTKTPELFPFRCPACGLMMAQFITADVTGWIRCQNRHRTEYRHGVPILTKKYGLPVRTNS